MSNEMNWMRRKFLQVSSMLGAGLLIGDAASAQHEHHQAPKTEAPKTEAPKTEAPKTEAPKTDKKNGKTAAPERDHQKSPQQAKQPPGGNAPVITPDLPKLEYKMENGVKVFNLTDEVVECEVMHKTHMG